MVPRHLQWQPLKMPMRGASPDRSNYVTGSSEDQSAYRSELAGTIGVLDTVAILVKQFHITSCAIIIALDSESAISEIDDNRLTP